MASPEMDQQLARLVPRAAGGDEGALQEVIRIVHPVVLRYARARISGSKTPTAEDVAQEICLAVATSTGSYVDQGRPFMAFVYGIASNKVADAHRAISRDRLMPTETIPEEEFSGPSPEESALRDDASNRAFKLLDVLNEKSREIIILRVFAGLSAEETAVAVGSTAGAVRVAQHRALAKLRKAVEEGESNAG